jgi:hypothetical protein
MNSEILVYNENLMAEDREICNRLANIITSELPDSAHKIWHKHPVWFLNENPIVGYSKQKAGVRLMFWSGRDFEEQELNLHGRKFKDASIFYTNASDINPDNLKRWLRKARQIQWDYKNIVKRKGKLERLN